MLLGVPCTIIHHDLYYRAQDAPWHINGDAECGCGRGGDGQMCVYRPPSAVAPHWPRNNSAAKRASFALAERMFSKRIRGYFVKKRAIPPRSLQATVYYHGSGTIPRVFEVDQEPKMTLADLVAKLSALLNKEFPGVNHRGMILRVSATSCCSKLWA